MKKAILFGTLLLIIFIATLTTNQNRVVQIKDINKKEIIYLHKKDNQDIVLNFYLHIYGYLDGKAKISSLNGFENSINSEKKTQLSILSKKIDKKFNGEYYSDTIILIYEPLEKIKSGNVKISYRFE